MILQKSFLYADLLFKKHFLSLSMLKTFQSINVLKAINVVETMKLFSRIFDKQKVQRTAFIEMIK